MRTAFIQALLKAAKHNPKIHLLTSDLGFEVFENFIELYPDRFTNVGVAEANMIGIASGMAQSGLEPICFSILPFLGFRTLEQIRNDICYPNLNVKIVGVGAGFAYGYNGTSHYAIEDLAALRSLPNLTIISPSDPLESYQATSQMLKMTTPVYLRLNRRGEPNLTYETIGNFKIGKAVLMEEGPDLALFTTGTMLQTALEVSEKLQKDGISISIINVHTLKPLDQSIINNQISSHPKIATLEEHSLTGGLGSAIAELNVSLATPRPQLMLGIPDHTITVGGDQAYLRKIAGIDAETVTKKIRKFVSSADDGR